jgi:hypothetical protein
MNKYSLTAHLQEELAPFLSTFKATSYDEENKQHLCSDVTTPNVYNFDAYVKDRCSHPIPASPDAIHVGSKDLYFVEFKNQRACDVNKEQMQRKFQAGTAILKSLLDEFNARDSQYHFCVVFKNQPRPRYMDFRHVENNVVKFGLDELNRQLGDFYDHVVTESLDFYVKEFKALKCA